LTENSLINIAAELIRAKLWSDCVNGVEEQNARRGSSRLFENLA
jgi:hypothetical protein